MHWSHARGEAAELKVLEEMRRRGYQLVRRRLRTPVAELDLVMRSLAEYLIIEVKSVTARSFLQHRLSARQKVRLRRGHAWVQDRVRADVRLILATVDEKGKIELFNLSAADLQ
ncbi:MAG: YraN family protein [Bdellovibrionaceae bacterium]|nr:YraN family protein [Pseudobdellovibrionaceae bacterium]MBX3034870.1 YraN family protein [Pseudobdellovibrionaceae bacterium]